MSGVSRSPFVQGIMVRSLARRRARDLDKIKAGEGFASVDLECFEASRGAKEKIDGLFGIGEAHRLLVFFDVAVGAGEGAGRGYAETNFLDLVRGARMRPDFWGMAVPRHLFALYSVF
jgi:hypothetical protein